MDTTNHSIGKNNCHCNHVCYSKSHTSTSSTLNASNTHVTHANTDGQAKRLSGAARKRLRKLVSLGINYEKARDLCRTAWNLKSEDVTSTVHPAVKRTRSEEVCPQEVNKKDTDDIVLSSDESVEDYQAPFHYKQEQISRVEIWNTEPMSEDQMQMVHHQLNLVIAGLPPGEGPQFWGFTHRNGWIVVTCDNKSSYNWIMEVIPKLQPWPEAQLSIKPEYKLPRFTIATTFIPEKETKSVVQALTLLKAQNKGLHTELWQVLNERLAKGGVVVTFSLDKLSTESLRVSNCEACIGFKKVYFKIRNWPKCFP